MVQGCAGGALLYAALVWVVARERAKQLPGLLQLAALLMAFGLLALLHTVGRNYPHNRQYLLLNLDILAFQQQLSHFN